MPDAYQQFIDRLSRCKRVLVTTHVRPDGDAVGTTAALVRALQHKNIEAEVLLLSHLPSKYAFVYQELGIKHTDVEKGWEESGIGYRVSGVGSDKSPDASASRNPTPDTRNPFFSRFDALLVADTGTWSQLPGLRERIANWRGQKLVLDHHLTQEDWADAKLVDTKAAAAAEIAVELIRRWGVLVDGPMAMALFLAIASDTGWFQFSNTRPQTLRLAADLMEVGWEGGVDRLYQLLYQNERPQRVALQTRAMQSLELLAGGKLAVMTIRRQDFTDTGAHVPDTENLINVPLQIKSVEVSLLLIEEPSPGAKERTEDGGSRMAQSAPAPSPSSTLHPPSSPPPIRVSLRSKGTLDVARFAEQFHGGGHARAAGLKLATSLEDAHARVVNAAVAALTRT